MHSCLNRRTSKNVQQAEGPRDALSVEVLPIVAQLYEKSHLITFAIGE